MSRTHSYGNGSSYSSGLSDGNDFCVQSGFPKTFAAPDPVSHCIPLGVKFGVVWRFEFSERIEAIQERVAQELDSIEAPPAYADPILDNWALAGFQMEFDNGKFRGRGEVIRD